MNSHMGHIIIIHIHSVNGSVGGVYNMWAVERDVTFGLKKNVPIT